MSNRWIVTNYFAKNPFFSGAAWEAHTWFQFSIHKNYPCIHHIISAAAAVDDATAFASSYPLALEKALKNFSLLPSHKIPIFLPFTKISQTNIYMHFLFPFPTSWISLLQRCIPFYFCRVCLPMPPVTIRESRLFYKANFPYNKVNKADINLLLYFPWTVFVCLFLSSCQSYWQTLSYNSFFLPYLKMHRRW